MLVVVVKSIFKYTSEPKYVKIHMKCKEMKNFTEIKIINLQPSEDHFVSDLCLKRIVTFTWKFEFQVEFYIIVFHCKMKDTLTLQDERHVNFVMCKVLFMLISYLKKINIFLYHEAILIMFQGTLFIKPTDHMTYKLEEVKFR